VSSVVTTNTERHGRLKVASAQAFAWYLRYFPIKKWKKKFASRVGARLEGIPLRTAYGFPIYSRYHDRTNRMGFQGKLGIVPAFVRQVPAGACFVDIGANHGVVTIMAARQVGPHGRVFAFEPVAETFAALQRNVQLNALSNVQVYRMAISDEVASVHMSAPDPLHSGAAHVLRRHGGDVLAAPLATIPEVAAAAARMPVYAKLDTEGYELQVLKGMRPLFEQQRVVALVVEIEPRHLARFGTTPADIYEEMHRLGYRPRLHAAPADRHYDEIFERDV
jgi:FkbM family methyltransferase